MTEFENTVITNPDKIKEIKQAIDSGESAFKDVKPAEFGQFLENASKMWFGLQGKCDALEQDKANLEGTIAELREENERIRNSTITQKTFKALMDEKDKEIAELKIALKKQLLHNNKTTVYSHTLYRDENGKPSGELEVKE